MSKHTVTMKSLIDENAQLRMRVHQLETMLIAERGERSTAPQKLWNDWRFTAGTALGWALSYGFNILVLSR